VLVFTDAILNWGEPRLRDLPWRRTRDPWKVLVSEVMLQQTQVDRVIPKWLAFIERFPDPASCAAATLADVLRLWQGLGYPRRARNLHLAAQHVVDRGGEFPDTLDALLALPGVGAYTARAVLAFAFESDAAVVDTNIARVYARVAGRPLTLREVQYTADAYLPAGESWVWNQTVMDLGAVLCRPSSPRCDACPVVSVCSWHGVGVDPAQGSAAVSRPQARFEGSDRQARGRLLKALTTGAVPVELASSVMQRTADDASRLVDDLVRDGLCARRGGELTLPV
jgi:A/G-specific adenine glycosylase